MSEGRKARVTFSYKPEQDDELVLEVGDIITNITDVDVGWCEGELNGKKGMFPDNFVEEFSTPGEEVPSASPLPSSNSKTGQMKHESAVRERFLIDDRLSLIRKKQKLGLSELLTDELFRIGLKYRFHLVIIPHLHLTANYV